MATTIEESTVTVTITEESNLKRETSSISSLVVGKYTIKEYERVSTKFGFTFVITAKNSNDEIVKFWGNKYLNNYISLVKPSREFEIIIEKYNEESNKVIIPNYNTKVILKPK